MTQKQKELLLKDLCARLPYGVKVQGYSYEDDVETIETLREIDSDGYMSTLECETLKHIAKPYLFPLSSITEGQKLELQNYVGCEITVSNHEIDFVDYSDYRVGNWDKIFNWLNKSHFDYRGLIKKGLAIDATGLNIY